jgi:hypothetical protein
MDPRTARPRTPDEPPTEADPAGAVVLDYCAAVRGILNDDQGGPLHPQGVRMAEALTSSLADGCLFFGTGIAEGMPVEDPNTHP